MPQHRRPKKFNGADGSKNRMPQILAGVVGMGLFYFFFIHTVPAPQAAMPAAAPHEIKIPQKEKFNIIAPEEARPEAPVDVKSLRRIASKNRAFEVKSLALTINNGEMQIPFRFIADKKWCVGGDLDTFKYLLTGQPQSNILITIETLTSTQRGDRQRTTLPDLYKGLERTFKLTLRNDPESLGLYMCTDSQGKNSCRGKEIISHEKLSDLLSNPATQAATKAKDYILYFQNFIVKDGKLVTYSNENISREGGAKLGAHLGEAFGVKEADYKAAYELNRVLRSMPAKIEGKQILLKLPYNDPRCLPGAREPAPE
jgi:hypothetical protein